MRLSRTFKCWLLVFLFLFMPYLVEAIEIIQIDQPKIRLNVLPGRKKAGTIMVSNPSSEAKHIKAYLEDWVYLGAGNGSKEFKPAGTTELSAANWISFSPAEFTVSPYGNKKVSYTIQIPEDARGGNYAILFFESLLGEPPEIEGGVVVPLAIRIGALFYIESEGTIVRKAGIENIKIERKEVNSPLMLQADFTNRGNVDITANGTFYIIDKNGMVYGRGRFNDVYTFPDYKVKLYAECKEVITAGEYDLVITLEIGGGETLVEELRIKITSDGKIITFTD
ncbi:MAG: hypothetical protein ABH815_03370 [Candidatus Omnitrophota bacterium]